MSAVQWQINEKWQKWLRSLVSLALVVWLAALLADTVWLFYSGPAVPVRLDRDMPVLDAGSAQRDASGVTPEQLAQWQLFGPIDAAPMTASGPVDAPETRLRLELLGVFENADREKASAIIAEQGKDAELYHAGDKLPGNATLEEVYGDRVILLRLGQREALRLKESELGAGAVAQTSTARTYRQPPSVPEPEVDQGVDASDLGQQRNMIISRLGLSPAPQGGYEIGPSAPAQVLDIVGLKPGDVLVSVNGVEVGSEEADVAALQEFQNTGAASIVVQRGEQRFTVNYPP
ncbi:MAG: hypothetical protein KDH99_05470 [Alcanivoracaceae bacterium]|nr:hypothetical protein [Alcanivoracaceae bacterium]